MKNDKLQSLIEESLALVLKTREFAKTNDLLNTQDYINFEMKLNEIGTMDPNL